MGHRHGHLAIQPPRGNALAALLPAAAAGFAGAFAGAWTVTALSPDLLRKVLPLVLLAVLAYTLAKKDLGRHHAPRFSGNAEVWVASLVGLGIGFTTASLGRVPVVSSSSCSCACWVTTS